MDNREKGKQLEEQVAEELQKIFQENPPIRPTKASSGGSHNTELADISSQKVYVECKNHKGKFFSKQVWSKLIDSIPLNSTKVPLYVIENEIEGILVCLTFNDLCRLLKDKNE
jgi:hypothetical protein